MAFQAAGTALSKCGLCVHEPKVYKMITSDRSEHMQNEPDNQAQFEGTEPSVKSKGLRICENCELGLREQEVQLWGDGEFLSTHPDYATMQSVLKDIKHEAKSVNWMSRSKAYAET